MSPAPSVKALLFDVFGTVVDWRSSIIRELSAWGTARGISADWAAFADSWRALYQPSMEEVRSGRRPWPILDLLHRESLDVLLAQHSITGLSETDKTYLNTTWHRLSPWPDTVAGLTRLKSKFVIGTLSNGNVALLTWMAKNAGLPWDVILSAETARAYKPMPEAYARSVAMLGLEPSQVMMVAAHNDDLAGAAAQGLATAFVARPTEHGLGQMKDVTATGPWNMTADSFTDLADKLGCP